MKTIACLVVLSSTPLAHRCKNSKERLCHNHIIRLQQLWEHEEWKLFGYMRIKIATSQRDIMAVWKIESNSDYVVMYGTQISTSFRTGRSALTRRLKFNHTWERNIVYLSPKQQHILFRKKKKIKTTSLSLHEKIITSANEISMK